MPSCSAVNVVEVDRSKCWSFLITTQTSTIPSGCMLTVVWVISATLNTTCNKGFRCAIGRWNSGLPLWSSSLSLMAAIAACVRAPKIQQGSSSLNHRCYRVKEITHRGRDYHYTIHITYYSTWWTHECVGFVCLSYYAATIVLIVCTQNGTHWTLNVTAVRSNCPCYAGPVLSVPSL